MAPEAHGERSYAASLWDVPGYIVAIFINLSYGITFPGWPTMMLRSFFLTLLGSLFLNADEIPPLSFKNEAIEAGTKSRLTLDSHNDFTDPIFSIPVLIVHGAKPGPRLAITAGIHGDELNGMEVARRLYEKTDPKELSGTLVILPIINYQGFLSSSRYLPDRRDLNRFFPGDPNGSTAAILADQVFKNAVIGSDGLIDLHCASDKRINLPQIRADYAIKEAVDMACHFGIGVVVHGGGPDGSLRRAASDIGIPSIIYETGSPNQFEENEIALGLAGIENVMRHFDMLPTDKKTVPASQVYSLTRWVRAPRTAGGNFFPSVELGDKVTEGQQIGQIIDPISGGKYDIISPDKGRVIGMSVPTIIFPGEAMFHLGLKSTKSMEHLPHQIAE